MAVIPLYLDADLQSVRKIVNDCVRDGVHFDSGFVAQIQLQEYPQFETPLRIIWGISHSAIEAARIADHRTQLKLLPVKGIHHDGEVWRVWKIISQQLYNAKLIESLAHLLDEGADAIGKVFDERDLIASPRPQMPDEEKFKKSRRAELKRNPNAHLYFGRKRADIKNALFEMWETEKQSCAKRQARWDEIHRLSALSLEQAIADYVQRGGEAASTQDTATMKNSETDIPPEPIGKEQDEWFHCYYERRRIGKGKITLGYVSKKIGLSPSKTREYAALYKAEHYPEAKKKRGSKQGSKLVAKR